MLMDNIGEYEKEVNRNQYIDKNKDNTLEPTKL